MPIFARLFALFGGENDPEAEKRKLLRQMGKELSKHRFRFYKSKGEEVQPLFARFFYDLYKIIAPAQVFLQNAKQSGVLRSLIIEAFLDKRMLEIQQHLSEESIKERAKTVSTKELSGQLKDELVEYFAGFDGERVRRIDGAYNLIISFVDFINFDYFFLLKKFDSNISERNFTYQPKFESIRAEYVTDDIKDFLEVLHGLEIDQDWPAMFSLLKQYKGVEILAVDQWMKMLKDLNEVRRSSVLELMIRCIDKDPSWQPKARHQDERIVEPYLQKLKTQTEVTIQMILQEKRNTKIDELAVQVFGTAAVSRLKNYTERANIVFSKKMLGGYTHIQGLNYLKAFLLDFFKKDIRELVDLFLIRGQWSTNLMSQQLSEGFHEIMAISDKLLAFDESLADEGEFGYKMRNAMARAERDKEQMKTVRLLLKDANDKAQGFINGAAQNLILVGKNLKLVLEDYQRSPHELIINWKEIELASEKPIDQRVTDVYRQIYRFVQLMQFFAKGEA